MYLLRARRYSSGDISYFENSIPEITNVSCRFTIFLHQIQKKCAIRY